MGAAGHRGRQNPTGFSMKPNTTRFHIKASFCHTIKASELYIGPQLMDFVMVVILKKKEENKMMMGVVVRLLMMALTGMVVVN